MSSAPCPCSEREELRARTDREELRARIAALSGAWRVGFARVEDVEPGAAEAHRLWGAAGKAAGMAYMLRHGELRRNPATLLEGARTLIAAAFPYRHPAGEGRPDAPRIARYARGADYHEVVRRRLEHAAAGVELLAAAPRRVCVDTAPLRERYWAAKAGIGFVGLNNTLIVPGAGSFFFLGEILTTVEIEPDEPCTLTCGECRRCVEACPGHALPGDGSALDARRCLSYLTIEHRGPFPEGTRLQGCAAGCDICQEVCPHNRLPYPPGLEEFDESCPLLQRSSAELSALADGELRRLLRHSALSRIKPADLRRNLAAAGCTPQTGAAGTPQRTDGE